MRNKKEIEELIKKWEKTGLLDDIDGILEKKDLAKILEGEASQLLREENQNKEDVTILPGTITTFEETMEAIKSENAADKDIKEISNSFKSYDKMYDDLLDFGVESLYHPIELEWMLEYFTKKEDYEKCSMLKNYINQNKDDVEKRNG